MRGELPPPAVISFRPGARRPRCSGSRSPRPSSASACSGSASPSAADWTGRASRRWRARDVRREIDVVEEVARFRLEDVPATLPDAAGDVRAADARPAAAPAGRGRARRRRLLRGVHLLAAAERSRPGGARAAGAAHLAAAAAAHDARRRPASARRAQRRPRATRHPRCSRSRTSICRGRDGGAGERWRLGGIVRGDFFRAKGAVEAVFDALHVEPRFERAQPLPGSTVGATVQGGWVAQHGPLELDGEWSAFELDLAELFAPCPSGSSTAT